MVRKCNYFSAEVFLIFQEKYRRKKNKVSFEKFENITLFTSAKVNIALNEKILIQPNIHLEIY